MTVSVSRKAEHSFTRRENALRLHCFGPVSSHRVAAFVSKIEIVSFTRRETALRLHRFVPVSSHRVVAFVSKIEIVSKKGIHVDKSFAGTGGTPPDDMMGFTGLIVDTFCVPTFVHGFAESLRFPLMVQCGTQYALQ